MNTMKKLKKQYADAEKQYIEADNKFMLTNEVEYLQAMDAAQDSMMDAEVGIHDIKVRKVRITQALKDNGALALYGILTAVIYLITK